MARAGITAEQVAAAADALLSEGQQPTIASIRERLGTGSPNTIQKHLTIWRQAQPVRGVDRSWQLPDAVSKAIHDEISRSSAEAKAEVEQRLVQAQEEAADLAELGETLEAERDAFAEQNVVLATERDVLTGKTDRQEAELLDLRNKVSQLESATKAAGIELAKEQLRRESLIEGDVERKHEIESLREEVASLQKMKIEAEQRSAVLAERVSSLQESAQRELDHLNKAINSATAAAEAADKRAEKALEQARQVQASLDEARQAEARAKEDLAVLRLQVAEAKQRKPATGAVG